MTAPEWEIVCAEHCAQVRRLKIPGGWLYQVSTSLRYRSAPGTCGRDNDPGTPVFDAAATFVPEAP